MTYSRCSGFMANCDKEGNALMQTKGQLETRQYPQSLGNLALANESLGVLQPPKAKTRSLRLSMVRDIAEEEEVHRRDCAQGTSLTPPMSLRA